MEAIAEFDGLVCFSLSTTRNPKGSDYLNRVDEALTEGGPTDDKFDLFDEQGSDFMPQVTEITWIYYDVKLKKPERDQHTLKISSSESEEGLTLKEGLESMIKVLNPDNDSKLLRVALVTFGHWEIGY